MVFHSVLNLLQSPPNPGKDRGAFELKIGHARCLQVTTYSRGVVQGGIRAKRKHPVCEFLIEHLQRDFP